MAIPLGEFLRNRQIYIFYVSECMINDVALMTLGGGYRISGMTLGSYQVQGGRGQELNVMWQR